MSRHKFLAGLIVGSIAFVPLARANEIGSADSLYENGVQAYFHGCSSQAESYFSSLMGVDPNDPRACYFRALSLMQQGREDEARSDMEIGAQIESRVPHRYDIGKTLERVQGPARLLLEQYRSRAHQVASATPPIGPVRAPDTAVLRERRIVPLDEFASPGDPKSVVAPAAPPQMTAPLPPAPSQPVTPPAAAPSNAADPFNDDSSGGATAKPQPKTPPAKAAAPKSPPAKAAIPPAPQPTPPAPKAEADDKENPFL